MIIKKIEIDNFRSYYGHNVFELSDGLNLIIGSNGDGKTTFFEAINWLFTSPETSKMDPKFVSKKRSEELSSGESDNVCVAMTYEHKGLTKKLEKTFNFMIRHNGDIHTSNFSFGLITENGFEREERDGLNFYKDFPAFMKKYIMFQGERELNVLQDQESFRLLIENFSEVQLFDAYDKFMELAVGKSEGFRVRAEKLSSKNEGEIKKQRQIKEREEGILSDIEREIRIKEHEVETNDSLLKKIEKSNEASTLLNAVKRRIDNLRSQRSDKAGLIKENYNINLLDDMWVLMGFEGIAEEFSSKINEVDKKRRRIEKDYLLTAGAERVIRKAQNPNFVPLPVHIPGQKIMQEMLDDEVCKICGRPAAKHTEAWNFMLQRLEEYKESLKASDNEDDDIAPCFKNTYIVELQKRETSLNDNLSSITRLRQNIHDRIALNNRLHDDIKRLDENIKKEDEQKNRILAHTDGLTEKELENNFVNINKWSDNKANASNRIEVLKRQREQHRELFEGAEKKLLELSKGTPASIYAQAAYIIKNISGAFKDAKEENKRNLISLIEEVANQFLDKLNINDFKGKIRISEFNGKAEPYLINNDDIRIFNPNTALQTTYLMSILFAIGQLSSKKDKTEFPLIFDAPTSSFTDQKENDFFRVVGSIAKQVIIVTKSFLHDTNNGGVQLDMKRIENINGRIYRIEKKKPFDDRKLGTIQTEIELIK